MRVLLVATAAVVMLCGVAVGEIPQVMGYQGRVTDNSGNPVSDGTYTMRFRIYDSATGGSLLWDSGNQSVSVGGGVFSVTLGESPQPTLNLAFDQDYWLLATFDGENQTPRKRLGSVGYAYMASGLVPGTEVSGSVTTGTLAAIKGTNTAATGATYGVSGQSFSTSGRGVYGLASATSGYPCGVYGLSEPGGSANGTGVHGQGNWRGVYGVSTYPTGVGVYAEALANAGDARAVFAESKSWNGQGVCGYASATVGPTRGVYGRSNSTYGHGVYGWASATTGYSDGVYGTSSSTTEGTGVHGYGFDAVSGDTDFLGGAAVFGSAWGPTGPNYGVFAGTMSSSGYAGWFAGDVFVNGTLSKSGGSFLIDHPLDPENKLLRHNFVESPENLLIYRGTVRLDAEGQAAVRMPEYFRALTKQDEATVNLTPVGRSRAPTRYEFSYDWRAAYDTFEIYGEPGREVAWMVMAERDDPVMRRLARPVEEDKGPDNKYCDRGKLLCPTAYGYPESMGRDYERHEKKRLRMEEQRRRMEQERARMDDERACMERGRARAMEEDELGWIEEERRRIEEERAGMDDERARLEAEHARMVQVAARQEG